MGNFFWDLIIRSIAELAFPVIKELLKLGMFNQLEKLVNDIKERIETGNKKQYTNATNNADSAESKAEAATTPEEATKYKAVAEVWREVAEGLKKENQELKKEVDSRVSNTETELAEYQAKAETWREAYESVHTENERLKSELDDLRKSAIASINKTVSDLQVSDVFDMSQPDKIELKKDNVFLNSNNENDAKNKKA